MKGFLIKGALVFSSILIALVSAEFLLRLFPRLLDIESNRLVEGNFEYHNKSAIITPSPTLGYEFIPDSIPQINSLGMLDKERDIKKSDSTLRIIFLGDSVTANGKIPAFLENKLKLNPWKKDCEIWNCAVGGYQVSQYGKYMQYKGLLYDPDLIIIGLCLNDFSYSLPIVYKTKEGRFHEYYNRFPRSSRFVFRPALFRLSKLYRFFFYIGEYFLSRFEEKENENFEFTEGSYWLNNIKKSVYNRNIPVLAVIYPYLKPLEEYTKKELHQYETMVSVVKVQNMPYIDLIRGCDNMSLHEIRREQNRKDFVHPNYRGDKIFAEKIYAKLLNMRRIL